MPSATVRGSTDGETAIAGVSEATRQSAHPLKTHPPPPPPPAGYTRRFLVPSVLLTLVGLGSIGFHGTLRYPGQVLDELTMVYCASALLYVVLETEAAPRRRWLAPALVGYNAAFTAVYLTLPSRVYFTFFVGSFICLCVAAFVHGVRLYRRTVDPQLKPLFWGGNAAFLGAFLFLWIPDNLFCAGVRHLHLHAWFHVTSGLANYAFIVFLTMRYYEDRCAETTKGRVPRASVPPTPLALRRPDPVDAVVGATSKALAGAAAAVSRRLQAAVGGGGGRRRPGGGGPQEPPPPSPPPPAASASASSELQAGGGTTARRAAAAGGGGSASSPLSAMQRRRPRVIGEIPLLEEEKPASDGSGGSSSGSSRSGDYGGSFTGLGPPASAAAGGGLPRPPPVSTAAEPTSGGTGVLGLAALHGPPPATERGSGSSSSSEHEVVIVRAPQLAPVATGLGGVGWLVPYVHLSDEAVEV
jgi:hypothetical protein